MGLLLKVILKSQTKVSLHAEDVYTVLQGNYVIPKPPFCLQLLHVLPEK